MSYRHQVSEDTFMDFSPLILTVVRVGKGGHVVTTFHYSEREQVSIADWLLSRSMVDYDTEVLEPLYLDDVGAPWELLDDDKYGFVLKGTREWDERSEYIGMSARESGNLGGLLMQAFTFTADDFQAITKLTDLYPMAPAPPLLLYAAGLSGEAGEVSNKVKKVYRDHNGVVDDNMRLALMEELGDSLWYCARLAAELGYTLTEVMQANNHKLQQRAVRQTLRGNGDIR